MVDFPIDLLNDRKDVGVRVDTIPSPKMTKSVSGTAPGIRALASHADPSLLSSVHNYFQDKCIFVFVQAEVMDCMKVGMPMPCNHLILIRYVLLQPRPLERTLRSTKVLGRFTCEYY